jgi:hypothetical protein
MRLYLDDVARAVVDTELPILKDEMYALPEIRVEGSSLSELRRPSTPNHAEYGEAIAYISCSVGARLQRSASGTELPPEAAGKPSPHRASGAPQRLYAVWVIGAIAFSEGYQRPSGSAGHRVSLVPCCAVSEHLALKSFWE